jgi:Zn finger protein HypA/HybF involved in hydrogenase expression
MRDFSIAQKLLDTALQQANSKRILNVHLRIGPFSEEREETIRFYWRDLARGTAGDGATLYFEHVPADTKCFGCGSALGFDENGSICEFCQSRHSQLPSGEDVKLERIEVE